MPEGDYFSNCKFTAEEVGAQRTMTSFTVLAVHWVQMVQGNVQTCTKCPCRCTTRWHSKTSTVERVSFELNDGDLLDERTWKMKRSTSPIQLSQASLLHLEQLPDLNSGGVNLHQS